MLGLARGLELLPNLAETFSRGRDSFCRGIFETRTSVAAAFLTGRFNKLVNSTLIMGATDITVSIPKPSGAPTALEKPMPIDSTKGTVTGPVVTPGGSKAQTDACMSGAGAVPKTGQHSNMTPAPSHVAQGRMAVTSRVATNPNEAMQSAAQPTSYGGSCHTMCKTMRQDWCKTCRARLH